MLLFIQFSSVEMPLFYCFSPFYNIFLIFLCWCSQSSTWPKIYRLFPKLLNFLTVFQVLSKIFNIIMGCVMVLLGGGGGRMMVQASHVQTVQTMIFDRSNDQRTLHKRQRQGLVTLFSTVIPFFVKIFFPVLLWFRLHKVGERKFLWHYQNQDKSSGSAEKPQKQFS